MVPVYVVTEREYLSNHMRGARNYGILHDFAVLLLMWGNLGFCG
jgi:hypothetical protein